MNLGYVGSLEFGRRTYECEFLWSIQDDMTLSNDVLSHLDNALHREPRLGVASPVLVRDGLVPARTRAGVFTNGQRTRWENWPFEDVPVENLDVPDDFCFVSGSGALYRSEALEDIGGFDLDLYPLMHVDVDTSLRLQRHNWHLALVREAHIEHQINGSTTPLLVEILHHINISRLHDRLDSDFSETSPARHQVPIDIVEAVARRASQLFLDVSREAEMRIAEIGREIDQLQQFIEELGHRSDVQDRARLTEIHMLTRQIGALQHTIDAMRDSRSWRATAPLRRMKKSLNKGRKRNGKVLAER